MLNIKKNAKAVYKIFLLRSLLLFSFFLGGLRFFNFRKRSKSTNSVLIIYPELMGDLAIFSIVLARYREQLLKQGKTLTLLTSPRASLGDAMREYAVLYVDPRKFLKSPFYAAMTVFELWGRFGTVINASQNQEFIQPDIIALSVGGGEMYRFKGSAFLESFANDSFFKRVLLRRIRSRYTRIFEGGKIFQSDGCITNVLWYHAALFRSLFGFSPDLTIPSIAVPDIDVAGEVYGKIRRISKEKKLCVFVVGAGATYRNWPLDRFLVIAAWVRERGYAIVFVGSGNDAHLYSRLIPDDSSLVNLMGKTSATELVWLIARADFVFGNETAPIHIAVALGKPAVCILGGGHFGLCSLYGVPGLHWWVYRRRSCFCDNWYCGQSLSAPNQPAPCVDAITVNDALGALEKMLLHKHDYSATDKKEIIFDASAFNGE